MQIDQEKIEAAIVREAVDGIISNDDLYGRVKLGIDRRIDRFFADGVEATLSASIQSVVNDGFERQYVKRDAFGKAIGEPTTVAKELEALVGSYWSDRVDRSGKKTESNYGSTSRAEWMMMQICADDFSKELKQHTVNVAGALKDHFRDVLHQHIASMLSDVFNVQTAGDKAAANGGGSAIIHPPAKPIGA